MYANTIFFTDQEEGGPDVYIALHLLSPLPAGSKKYLLPEYHANYKILDTLFQTQEK